MTRDDAAVNLAIASVLKAEGGYKAPEPDDPNPTKYGVTQWSWAWFADEIPTYLAVDNVANIDLDDAVAFYRKYLTGCSPYHDIRRVRPLIPMVMLAHCQVLMGHSAGVRVLQRALNHFRAVVADGLIGEKTIRAFELMEPRTLVQSIEIEWMRKLDRIIEAHPEKAVYRNGWMNRASGWHEGWKP